MRMLCVVRRDLWLKVAVVATALCGWCVVGQAQDSSEKSKEAEAATVYETPDFIESGNPMSGDQVAMEAGHRLYTKWCAACHGLKADGESTRFGSYAANLTGYWRGYGEFVAIVLNGRVKKQMPPWKDVLNVEEISQVGAYLETLSVEGAIWK